MNKFIQINVFLVTGVLAVGCAPVPPPQQPFEIIPEEEVQNRQDVGVLLDIVEIKHELKQLRNSVEKLEFETEYMKRRQRDLFQDMDRRLIGLERNNPTLGPEMQDPQTQDPLLDNGDDQAVADNSVSQSDTGHSEPSSVTLEEQQAYDAAFDLLKQSLYEDAISEFQQFVEAWPNSQLADDAYYWMSEAMYVNREFQNALKGFRALVTQYPDSQRVPEALLKVGYIQYDIGAYNEAAETFREILSRFPGHQVTVSAHTRLRRIEQTIQE